MCLSCGCGLVNEPHNDSRNITMLNLDSAAKATSISPLEAAQNILSSLNLINKSIDPYPSLISCEIFKSAPERRFTLGLAYPAMKLDVDIAADSHRDFVSAEKLEETAWNWMKSHQEINLFHQNGTSGHGKVVESYIWRAPNWEITSPVDGQTYVIKSGDWVLGSLWDTYGWHLIKSGLINGWSPEGAAVRSHATPKRLAQLRS